MMRPIAILAAAALFYTCQQPASQPENGAIQFPDEFSSCPYLTTDDEGRPVISYVSELNDSVSVMRYRISSDGGASFGEPIEITPSTNVQPHGENLPKIIFKPNKEIIAVWGSKNPRPENKYAGRVSYSQSFDGGRTWSPARALVTSGESYDQRYFDLALLANGEAGIIWLDNRESEEQEGSSVFFASSKNREGFAGETKIAESICPCCRTELYADKKGNLHACFRDIIQDSIRDMVHVVSVNGGKSFSEPRRISADNWVISGCPHTGPTMTRNERGLHFAWYSGAGSGGVFYCQSLSNGRDFSMRDTVSNVSSAKHPQLTSSDEGDLLMVWDETVKHGETYNARIGFQLRDGNGKITHNRSLTADSLLCEYPVILSLGNRKALTAYSQKKENKKQVAYQVISY